MGWPVVLGREFQIDVSAFAVCGLVLDAQVRQTDLAVDDRQLVQLGQILLPAGIAEVAVVALLVQLSVDLLLEFEVENDAVDPASCGLDLGRFGLIHLVDGGVVRDLGGFDEPGIDGLSFGGQAVMLGEAFGAFREHDDAADLALLADADRTAKQADLASIDDRDRPGTAWDSSGRRPARRPARRASGSGRLRG